MNFSPASGCDIAIENLKGAGLPIRDRDLPQVKSQQSELSQSQQHSQERPGSLNAHQVVSRQSSQSLFPGSSQPSTKKGPGAQNACHKSAFLPIQPAPMKIRPISAPSGLKQNGLSNPISTSSGSTLNAFGSTITVTSVPMVPEPRTQSGLLPSPIFNGEYAPFGGFHIRPMSAPERAQAPRDHTSIPSLPQILPSERVYPVPEKYMHSFRTNETASQHETAQTDTTAAKPKTKRQTKPRAQPAKPRKSRAKAETTGFSSGLDPSARNSPISRSAINRKASSSNGYPKAQAKAKILPPCAPPTPSVPQLQNIAPSSVPPAPSMPDSRKHFLTDKPVDQPNKRPAQTRVETETTTESLAAAIVAEQPAQLRPPPVTDLQIHKGGLDLLQKIDRLMKKRHDDSINNLMKSYHGLPTPNQQAQSLSSNEHPTPRNAAQSDDEEDSAKALDDLICKCSKDENFEKLMDALEAAWKRTTLSF